MTTPYGSPHTSSGIAVARARGLAHARSGLQRARDQIARDSQMSESVRAEVLAELDAEIARIQREE